MCGRFTHLFTWKQLHRLMSLVSPEVTLPLRFNVAPTQEAPVIVPEGAGASLRSMRWGLVPSWAKDVAIGNSLINARAEGIEAKPSFRSAFKRRRCVVPVSGFFEWQKIERSKTKQPYYIVPSGSNGHSPTTVASKHAIDEVDTWLLAGLWEAWHDPALPKDAPALETFTIITTDANEAMALIHNRMPVILEPAAANRWIGVEAAVSDGNEATSPEELALLLRPCPSDWMAFRRVSTLVNSPRNNVPECIQEITQRPTGKDFGSIFDQNS